MRITIPACATALFLLTSGAALAFDAAAPTGPSGASQETAPAPGAAARSAKSIACSQKADAQAIHGKERKRFMRECKHAQ
jgi:hypothetical protein